MDLHGQSVGVTVSLGTALAAAGEAPADVVRRADQAMYAAKRGGRNRVGVGE
jgi:PleD family two-component response regulator